MWRWPTLPAEARWCLGDGKGGGQRTVSDGGHVCMCVSGARIGTSARLGGDHWTDVLTQGLGGVEYSWYPGKHVRHFVKVASVQVAHCELQPASRAPHGKSEVAWAQAVYSCVGTEHSNPHRDGVSPCAAAS